MSVFTGKNILIAGEVSPQIDKLEQDLSARGILVDKMSCDNITPELISSRSIDLVILNYLKSDPSCKKVLNCLQATTQSKVIPVFVLVEDTSEKIQEVLSYGVTDYLVPSEELESILMKIRAIFSESNTYNNSSAIDISPVEASVSSTGIRVYVIEDDPLLRNLLSIRLEKSSFPFEFSSDGKHVIPIIKQFNPDVIVLDLMLPGKSGFEILEELRADDFLQSVPVIVFSNRDGQDDRQKAKELGADGFYVKAMTDLSELIEKIESLVKI